MINTRVGKDRKRSRELGAREVPNFKKFTRSKKCPSRVAFGPFRNHFEPFEHNKDLA